MNYVLIVIVIILVVLIYVLWKYFSNTGTKVTTNTNLNTIQTTGLTVNDTSVQYAYGIWVYVNSWNPSSASSPRNTIFSRSSSNSNWDTTYTTSLYLGQVSPTLYLDISQNTPVGGISVTQPIIMTSNFPIQKWCYVVFSVNNQYVDCYLDGKLVKSVYLNGSIKQPVSGDKLYLGSPKVTQDIYINSFYHWANPLTPQNVWSNYLSGSGTNPFSALTNTIGFGFAFYQNNVESSTYRLF